LLCCGRGCCCCTPADAPSWWNKLPTVADRNRIEASVPHYRGDRNCSVNIRISALCTNFRRSAATAGTTARLGSVHD